MFRKLGTERASRDIQSRVRPDDDPKVKEIIDNTTITDLIIREYNIEQFDEELWRMKWSDWIHPHTGETGTQYLNRMTDNMLLNPSIQKASNTLVLIEPLYGRKR